MSSADVEPDVPDGVVVSGRRDFSDGRPVDVEVRFVLHLSVRFLLFPNAERLAGEVFECVIMKAKIFKQKDTKEVDGGQSQQRHTERKRWKQDKAKPVDQERWRAND